MVTQTYTIVFMICLKQPELLALVVNGSVSSVIRVRIPTTREFTYGIPTLEIENRSRNPHGLSRWGHGTRILGYQKKNIC